MSEYLLLLLSTALVNNVVLVKFWGYARSWVFPKRWTTA